MLCEILKISTFYFWLNLGQSICKLTVLNLSSIKILFDCPLSQFPFWLVNFETDWIPFLTYIAPLLKVSFPMRICDLCTNIKSHYAHINYDHARLPSPLSTVWSFDRPDTLGMIYIWTASKEPLKIMSSFLFLDSFWAALQKPIEMAKLAITLFSSWRDYHIVT